MSREWNEEYRGFGIVASESWLNNDPKTASFSITKKLADESIEIVVTGHQCIGTFPNDDEAHAAARTEAQAWIDAELAKHRG